MIKKIAKRVAVGALLVLPMVALAQVGTDPFGTEVIAPELEPTFGTASLQVTIARIINVALSLLGIVAVVIILAGGFRWMTAGGNEENVEKAKKLIFAGVIGIAIILSAYAIARFVLSSLLQATGAPGT